MSKKVLLQLALVFSAFVFSFKISAQTKQFFEPAKVDSKALLMPRANVPHEFKIFRANFQNLNDFLLNAPLETDVLANPLELQLPDANGKMATYAIYNSPLMEDELAAQTPGIFSYIGYNLKDRSNNIRLAVSRIHGVHLMGYNGDGETYYMDTYTQDLQYYILYKRGHINNNNPTFYCLNSNEDPELLPQTLSVKQPFSQDAKFRRYRLALACTVEYSAFHVNNAPVGTPIATEAQKKDVVLSAMNVTLSRVNQVFERDLSVRLQLVANNRNIIFINSDNFNNESAGQLINQSQSVITNIIGSSAYDVGHTFSTGGGGLAGLGVICSPSSKASGITGLAAPVGDPFDIDYVSHELGHQFGADHTFNGSSGSCMGNIGNVSAEPGSGSTIMAYAGICPPYNVQNNSDPYFHYFSIQQIFQHLATQASCAVVISTANATPNVEAGVNYTIPKSTPFKLTASATDANSQDILTYTWEQLDTQTTSYPITGNIPNGPNFRSVIPTTNNYRYFPSLATVLQGTTDLNTPPNSQWEKLSRVARVQRFGVTVRDNNIINGGQTKQDFTNITVANVGPFVLTYPSNIASDNPAEQWQVNTQKTITWNVAGTTSNGINTSHVNILYTTNEGETFIPIENNVPNNGSRTIQVPSLPDNTLLRIMIQPADNIYYAISQPVKIVHQLSNTSFDFDSFIIYPNPTKGIVSFAFIPESNDDVSYQVVDLSGKLVYKKSLGNVLKVEETFSLAHVSSGVYILQITNGNYTTVKKIIKQ